MGLIAELEYRAPAPNRFQRLVNRAAGTRPGAGAVGPLLRPLDLFIHKLTRGRSSLTEAMAGQPVIWLDVSRSRGEGSRLVPLLPVPVGPDLAVIGSNFGRKAAPAWVADLEAHPEVRVILDERSAVARARSAGVAEIEGIWESAGTLYPGYLRYRTRVTSRPIRVFVLEPTPRVPSAG